MCGRYVRRADKQKIAEYFHATPQPAELPLPSGNYNVALITFQPIIRQSREWVNANWSWHAGAWFGALPKNSPTSGLVHEDPIGFAGLWDAWKDKEGHWLQSFAIVTPKPTNS